MLSKKVYVQVPASGLRIGWPKIGSFSHHHKGSENVVLTHTRFSRKKGGGDGSLLRWGKGCFFFSTFFSGEMKVLPVKSWPTEGFWRPSDIQ